MSGPDEGIAFLVNEIAESASEGIDLDDAIALMAAMGLNVSEMPLIAPSEAAPYVIALTVVPYIFLFVATQAISDYIAYRDIFHPDEAHALPRADVSTR